MTPYAEEYVEFYGDRFVALNLRDDGITFEQYLATPNYHESRILARRIREGRTTERDLAMVLTLEHTVGWCRTLAAAAIQAISEGDKGEAQGAALAEILRICDEGARQKGATP